MLSLPRYMPTWLARAEAWSVGDSIGETLRGRRDERVQRGRAGGIAVRVVLATLAL
jgi:hypothetical protein